MRKVSYKFNLIGFTKLLAGKRTLKNYWKQKVINSNLLFIFLRYFYNIYELADVNFHFVISIFLFYLISLAGFIGLPFYILGYTSHELYRFFFNNFTIFFLCLNLIGMFVLNFILYNLYYYYHKISG
jgi:hypothetical protein